MRYGPLLLLLCGCGSVHYRDPNAPQLFRSQMQYAASAVSEPLVWLPLIDLFDESGTGCSAAQAWGQQLIRGAMLATDRNAAGLAGALVSPDCTQAAGRGVDAASLQQQIAAAVAARPGAHVRVVIVYLNNSRCPRPTPCWPASRSFAPAATSGR